jgi:hypothetical protein
MGDHAAATTTQPSRRRDVRRLRIACTRCRQRKIRCCAATPSCTACMRSGARCVYEDDLPVARRQQLQGSSTPVPSQNTAVDEGNDDIIQTSASAADAPRLRQSHVGTALQDGDSNLYAQLSPTRPRSPLDGQRSPPPDQNLSHQVGLVSLAAGIDPKYIGSSSGYFFTQMLRSTSTGHEGRLAGRTVQSQDLRQRLERDVAVQAFKNIPIGLPATEGLTKQLSEAYFDTIHLQYPFIHKPSHERLIHEIFETDTQDEIATFQVTMVLSISALILSRRSHVELPSAGWCAAAVNKFSSLHVENSLRGLQCLLLLMVYAMHSPSSHFNAWNVNYQCIAMVIDLGLQREPSRAASLSFFQKEMRTRVFWVVYSLDRKLSTMMGRPIGLRDEACDLRVSILSNYCETSVADLLVELPAQVSDDRLEQCHTIPNVLERAGHMVYAVHFFKLARINSEMKYVLHSVNRETPSYAYPAVRDMLQWQESVGAQLADWYAAIPHSSSAQSDYGDLLCKTQYHTMNMLLFLPSPGIPQPRPEPLRNCYRSSISAIKLFRELYAREMLVYNWSTCHAVILHAFCLIYCVTTVPALREETSAETLLTGIRAASDILSATGEYWTGARKSRDLLNELASRALLRDLKGITNNQDASLSSQGFPSAAPGDAFNIQLNNETSASGPAYQVPHLGEGHTENENNSQEFLWENQDLSFLFGGFPYGSGSHEFDMGSLFVDAINPSGNSGSDMPFTF